LLFNSFQFLIFFPIVTAVFFLLAHRFRWLWLLIASCYFYMVFQPVYILILAFTIGIDYWAGLLIEDAPLARRRFWLILSIVANTGVLAVFKYYNFINESFRTLAGPSWPIPNLDMLLPIGLSFHTFQSLSYTIEVYRGRQKAERNAGIFALYVMFYPQLVAGPIERPQNLLHQFHERHWLRPDDISAGLRLMLWGFIKKVVIADRLAPFADAVYNHPGAEWPGISYILATIFFAFQIYCDFSGYSDIAIGAARVMGFRLMTNFDSPYLSTSVGEFWRRWHISLSTWFRDYVYIPLGGSQASQHRRYFNLLATFLISGLWHGASWTFVIWGGLNGVYLILEQIFNLAPSSRQDRLQQKMSLPVQVLRTIAVFTLISFAWIFFRARTISDALHILTHLTAGLSSLPQQLFNPAFVKANIMLGQQKTDLIIGLASIILLLAAEILHRNVAVGEWLRSRPRSIRWSFYYAGIAILCFFGAFNSVQQFIYFQF
jgi:alginate O-acetyltransferase complex protein AlgI